MGVSVSTPVLLLDVDGVLNALPHTQSDLAVWTDWQHGSAVAEGSRWPITWSPSVVSSLRQWHEAGQVELRWLTTWGHDANFELRELLGLPELGVAGTYRDAGAPTVEAEAGEAHASVAPAAPDPLSGAWWKYDVVARLIREEAGRHFIWVDDDLHRFEDVFFRWAFEHTAITPIAPDPRCGLSQADLAAIAAAL
jgi:hypothetical protein